MSGRPGLRRVLAGIAVAAAAVPVAVMVWIAWPLPPELRAPQPVPSITLVDRSGMPLRTTRSPGGERGGWLPIDEMDADVISAFIAAEDQRFFRHRGIDGRALVRAVRDNVRHRRVVSGASTISMQTARLLRGTGRNSRGKVAQALWALRLEAHLDKHAILERYLNRVPLGQGTVGVPAAAALYFDASAADLSVGQAALLAGFARSPARDNAIASAARAEARRRLVLGRMEQLGFIAPDAAAAAAAEPVAARTAQARFLAPHFTTRVLAGLDDMATGVHRTTLDLDLQRALEAEVRHAVAILADRAAAHAAVVVLDNGSGDVLAWVGSPDFAADSTGQVDMVVSRRQPGSALKPFLYGMAFDRGFTAATVLPDVPRSYATAGGPYSPQNYDRRFRGPVRVREALGSSYNVAAVELTERVGTSALLRTLQDAGFASLSRDAEHYGLGLALGNGDVTLLELANAYRGLANGGAWRPHRVLADAAPGPARARGEARRARCRGSIRATVHEPGVRRHRPRHPVRPRRADARLRHVDAAGLPVPHGGQDRHEPALHGQLGRGDNRTLHGGGLGRQLQRAAHAAREWHQRCGTAAAARGVRDRASPPTRPPGGPGAGRPDAGGGVHALGHARDTRLPVDDRVVRARYGAAAGGHVAGRRPHHAAAGVRRMVSAPGARRRRCRGAAWRRARSRSTHHRTPRRRRVRAACRRRCALRQHPAARHGNGTDRTLVRERAHTGP
jgi:hypothetical protein